MASMSNYLENKLIDHIFRGVEYTMPDTLALALCTSAPDDGSTGSTIAEVPNNNSYTRVALNPSTTNWLDTAGGTAGTSSGTNGSTSNGISVAWPTATGSWGTITHVALCDSATWREGNVLFWGALDSPQAVNNGNTVNYAISSLVVQIDN